MHKKQGITLDPVLVFFTPDENPWYIRLRSVFKHLAIFNVSQSLLWFRFVAFKGAKLRAHLLQNVANQEGVFLLYSCLC